MQGMPWERMDRSSWKHSEFMELAGNAFNGYVFAAWVVATFVAVPLQDVPSMPNDADQASIASSTVGDVFWDDASTD